MSNDSAVSRRSFLVGDSLLHLPHQRTPLRMRPQNYQTLR